MAAERAKFLCAPHEARPSKVGAHYAISSLFEAYAPRASIYCYQIDAAKITTSSPPAKRASLSAEPHYLRHYSRLRPRYLRLSLHLGDHEVTGGVREFRE